MGTILPFALSGAASDRFACQGGRAWAKKKAYCRVTICQHGLLSQNGDFWMSRKPGDETLGDAKRRTVTTRDRWSGWRTWESSPGGVGTHLRHGVLGRTRGDRELVLVGQPTIDMNVPAQRTCSEADLLFAAPL